MLAPTRSLARLAGGLYLVLIAAGIGSEGLVRSALVVPGDPLGTAARLVASETALRLSVLADVVMALADVGLGAAMLVLLWRAGAALAIAATAFRLAQAAILGLNLVFLLAAVPLAHGLPGVEGSEALAALALDLHGIGYDIGLFFFGINSLLTSVLLHRAGFPQPLAAGVGAAGVVYLVGSTLTVVAPAFSGAFAAAYVVPLVAELGLALWLVARAQAPVSKAQPSSSRVHGPGGSITVS